MPVGSNVLNPGARMTEPTFKVIVFLVSLKLMAPEGQCFSQAPHSSGENEEPKDQVSVAGNQAKQQSPRARR